MRTPLLKSSLVMLILGISSTAVLSAGNDQKEPKKDIVQTAAAAGSFKTLALALTEADLLETLKQDGPYTVFAPTDEAFAKIPEVELNKLLRNKEQLKSVLLYHVVPGKVMSNDVVKLQSAKTVEGNAVTITVKNKGVKIDNANVVVVDLEATNGVIHVIDSVIMPPAPAEESSH